jgi:ribonucleoside-diphosphate reductase alpha chain
MTDGGMKSAYVIVSFGNVEGVVDGKPVSVSRPLEVFVPGTQEDVPQDWVTVFARQLSLLARNGMLAKALQDARQVKSDRGRVRYGFHEKSDGTKVPRFHDSEPGALAYAIQRMLFKRGLLDSEGYEVPIRALIKKPKPLEDAVLAAEEESPSLEVPNHYHGGSKCPECGAFAVHRRDGCQTCESCGWVGSCG